MTERLKEELDQLGDGAPELRVPEETWARGRRARARDRLLTGLLAASLVLLAGTLIQVTPASRLATDVLAPAPDATAAVPDRLRFWPSPLAVADPAVGIAAVAIDYDRADVVVVGANDGGYHLLRLPRGLPSNLGGAVELDSSGRFLAYSWIEDRPRTDSQVGATGVKVLNLVTGETRSFPITSGAGVDVTDLVWSPTSDWVAWSGPQATTWHWSGGVGAKYGPLAFGRIALATGAVEAATTKQDRSVTVDSTGRVWLLGDGVSGALPDWAAYASASDGMNNMISSATTSPDDTGVLLANHIAVSRPDLALIDLPAATAETASLPDGDYPSGIEARPLGWIDTSHALVDLSPVRSVSANQSVTTRRDLAVVDVTDLGAAPRLVTRIDDDLAARAGSISVATDLMSVETPTVSRRDPWPWTTPAKLAVAGLGALVLALAIALVVRRRRLP